MDSHTMLEKRLVAAGERAVIGVSIAGGATRAAAVRGRIDGQGYEARLDVLASAKCDVPRHCVDMFQRLDQGDQSVALVSALTTGLTQLAASLIGQLGMPDELTAVLAAGVTDPGLWQYGEEGPSAYLGLCDGAQLAEATGLTIIDAFPARDVAIGGRGGPLDALPLWMLLHDVKKPRVLIDLGRTSTRLVYLPASCEGSGAARVLGLEIAPGMELLNRLTFRFTDGKQTCDVGGKLAAQARVIPEVLEHFSAAPCLTEGAPRWRPSGMPLEWFFDAALGLAVEAGWSVGDLLTSATQFIAASVEQAVKRRVPKLPPLEQLVLAGGGQHNGFLVREIARRLPDLELLSVADLGIEPALLDATSTAVLALMHVQQLPAATMLLTGAAVPRVLGRLTPGTPHSWRRLLNQIAAHQADRMTLRSAM